LRVKRRAVRELPLKVVFDHGCGFCGGLVFAQNG
jgi:hypothetical protein